MADTTALRNKILQLAIEGKLVEQRAEEGDARTLLDEIKAEKAQLIAEKKIKKDKPLAPIEDSETPFDIPDCWAWVRLGEVTYSVGSKCNQIKTNEVMNQGILPVVSQSQLLIDGYTDNEEKKIEDLPLIMFGDHTRNVKFIDFPFVIGADGTKFHKPIIINPKYLFFWMRITALNIASRGYERHYSILKNIPIPLPPLGEQKRIVEKLDEVMKALDEIEQGRKNIEALKDKLRNKALQLAIEGKLVEQRAEEGDARALLDEIKAEKAQLIAEKKIKKDKPLAPIDDSEIPFDIPDSWVWVRLGEVCNYGNALKKVNASMVNEDFWVLDLEDLEKGGRLMKRVSAKERKSNGEKTIFKKGDILYSKLRPYLLKMLIAPENGICTSEIVPFNMYGEIAPKYILTLLKGNFINNIINEASYGVKMPRVNTDTMQNLPIPLPPLGEQKRIVEKLDEVMAEIDKL